ncbi:MAG TPA: hypothetical protein ENI87_04020, partial [bacterium]|nr:hypothetical protein [bacterium]
MIEFVHDKQRRPTAPIAATVAPRWPSLLVVSGLALVVYLPAVLGAELLRFDDNFFFGPQNPEFRAGLASVWTGTIANAYLPVAHTSLWFDWYLADGASFLPHLHNLLLHAAAGYVLARLLLQLGVTALAANVVAALFVVHPALCESVAWVSSRKYVLSGLFVFVALWQTARFARAPAPRRALWIGLLGALAMYSNATAVVLPLLAVLVAAWCGGPGARWWAVVVLFCVTVPIALHHRAIAAEQGTMLAGELAASLPQAPGAFWHYLCTAVWPVGLNVLYPEVDTLQAFRGHWLAGTIALAAFVAFGGGLWCSTRARAIAAGLLGFVVALLPFNTVWPASSIAAADRYLYLAIPWLALSAVAVSERLHARGPWLAALLAAPLVWLGAARAHDFRDDASLWQASLDVDDNNAVAHLNFVEQLLRQPPVPYDDVVAH